MLQATLAVQPLFAMHKRCKFKLCLVQLLPHTGAPSELVGCKLVCCKLVLGLLVLVLPQAVGVDVVMTLVPPAGGLPSPNSDHDT